MIQASNMALLGFFSRLAIGPYTAERIQETIEERVPKKVRAKNLDIFRQGLLLGEGLESPLAAQE